MIEIPGNETFAIKPATTLPHTFESITPTVETLGGFNTELYYASPEALAASLPVEFAVRSADHIVDIKTPGFELVENGSNVVSTVQDPAVMVMYGASFCTLMLAKDNYGNAVGIHQPIIYEDGNLRSIKNAIIKARKFFSGVKEVIGDNEGFLLVSGNNPSSVHDQGQEHISKLAHKQLRHGLTRLDLLRLFIKPSESLGVPGTFVTNLGRNLQVKWNTLFYDKSSLTSNVRNISGLIFVPRQIDPQGKDKIFIIDPNTDKKGIVDALFPAASKGEPST